MRGEAGAPARPGGPGGGAEPVSKQTATWRDAPLTRRLYPCRCLYQAEKPFLPFLAGLAAGADFGTTPLVASHGEDFSADPEAGDYDDEDDYR